MIIIGAPGRCRLKPSLLGLFLLLGRTLLPSLEAADQKSGNGAEGLVLWKEGRCEVIDETRLHEAFEAYLVSSAIPADTALARIGKLREAAKVLGPGIPTPDELGKAYGLLQQLASDPLDENRCAELVVAIRRISEALSRQRNPSPGETAMRRQEEILSWNIAVGKKYSDLVNAPSVPLSRKPKTSETDADDQQLSKVMNEIRQIKLGGEVTGLQVRLDLQDLALRFLTQGDYEESILAVRFYRGLFADKNIALRLGPEAKQQIATSANSSPDLGVIESLATTTLATIREGLVATTTYLQSGALVGASRSLMAAFAQGSRTLEVRSYPEADKGKILRQILSERKLSDFLANKDYESALEVLSGMEGQAGDFHGNDYRVTIQSGKALSSIHLAAARKAGLEGNDGEMLRELEQATDFWPRNPGIAQVVAEFQGSSTIQLEVIKEYDELYASHKVREISRGKDRFEAALSQLPTRHAEFLAALEEWKTISTGSERASELRDFGFRAGAWELAENLCRRYPEQQAPKDLKSSMRIGIESLADGVDVAMSLEKNQPASALGRYLCLQRDYPQSGLISEGIARLSQKLLEQSLNTTP
jgi:hypothetical protein